jgi:hypothetical protein
MGLGTLLLDASLAVDAFIDARPGTVLSDARDGVRSGYKEGVNFQSDFVDDIADYGAALDGMGLSEKIGHYAGVAAGELVNIFTFGAVAYKNMYSLPSDVRLAGRIDDSNLEDDVSDAYAEDITHLAAYVSEDDVEDWAHVELDSDGNVVLLDDEERVYSGIRCRYFANGVSSAGRRDRNGSNLENSVNGVNLDGEAVNEAPYTHRIDELDKADLENYLILANRDPVEDDFDVDSHPELGDEEAVKMYWSEALKEIEKVQDSVIDGGIARQDAFYDVDANATPDPIHRTRELKPFAGTQRTDAEVEADRSIAYQAKLKLVDEGKARITKRRGVDKFGIPILEISTRLDEFLPEEGR